MIVNLIFTDLFNLTFHLGKEVNKWRFHHGFDGFILWLLIKISTNNHRHILIICLEELTDFEALPNTSVNKLRLCFEMTFSKYELLWWILYTIVWLLRLLHSLVGNTNCRLAILWCQSTIHEKLRALLTKCEGVLLDANEFVFFVENGGAAYSIWLFNKIIIIPHLCHSVGNILIQRIHINFT